MVTETSRSLGSHARTTGMSLVHTEPGNDHELTPHGAPEVLRLSEGERIFCGPENRLIRVVADEVIQELKKITTDVMPDSHDVGVTWLPLVLYGDGGTGKSHVSRAFAACWADRLPDAKVSLLTAADIGRALRRTELADAIDQFTRRHKYASLLVVDDLHQLRRESAADDWLTHILDDRIRRQQPTLITCDNSLARKLSSRLRSRLLGGTCVRLELPSLSTRRVIVETALAELGETRSPQEMEGICGLTAGKTVRGVWSSVAAMKALGTPHHESATIQSTDDFVHKLLQTTARKFGVRLNDMRGPSRRKNTVLARGVAMFLLRELTQMSLTEVGSHFRDRDHTTVRHACKKIKELLRDDSAAVGGAVEAICQTLDVAIPDCCYSSREQCA